MRFTVTSVVAVVAAATTAASAWPTTSKRDDPDTSDAIAPSPYVLGRDDRGVPWKPCTPEDTDMLVLHTSMDDFQRTRQSADRIDCNWHTDNCTKSPDRPVGFDFLPSCQRHDFGYHNTKAQGRFADMKDKIDDNFKRDLYEYCDRNRYEWKRAKYTECKVLAKTYYEAVHKWGKRKEGHKAAAVNFARGERVVNATDEAVDVDDLVGRDVDEDGERGALEARRLP
ncbi:hypothetical protein JDV02_007235 [Purpureocillium takamizusanense]|uniref:Secretory phospholipase A2 n=1 Tax=Purpureocillium takamizusanense TaxID=2060973 RepID=A0A9Q8QKE8_9HYPO|nr:uncharacterized protein JDV02_007235 [Purpureocillium takamizusanense]UNI21225.1 hypothetical protein JDV02_007235 [Purpureocillium takamizusanense]